MLWRIRAAITRRIQPWLRVSLRRELLDSDLETFRDWMTGRVLEIGAGRERRRGAFQPPFEAVSGWLFVDLAPGNRPHVQADAALLPFESACFDTLVCLEVLEYADDPLLAMREMRRVLKPDGFLIVSLPFLHRWDDDHDYWRLTAPGLTFALTRAGFRVEQIATQGGPLAVMVNVARHVLAKHEKGMRWQLFCLILGPILHKMAAMDREITARAPTYRTFTTGLIALARA